MEKAIYLVLTDTGTVLTKLIKLYTKAPYNHVSIALDCQLRNMYSFGRKKPNNPWIGGFVKEQIGSGIFNDGEMKCAIYRYEVTKAQYEKIKRELKKYEREHERYKYNFIGLIGVMLNRGIERQNAFFCSQFIATLLMKSQISVMHKPPSLTTPYDFSSCTHFDLIYEGTLHTYIIHNYKNKTVQENSFVKEFTYWVRQKVGFVTRTG